jgi:hypothetical protein
MAFSGNVLEVNGILTFPSLVLAGGFQYIPGVDFCGWHFGSKA